METTTAISTQLAGLPAILEANEGLKMRAIAQIDQKMAQVQQLDLTTLPVEIGDQYDLELSGLQTRGNDSVVLNKERRTPFTKEMDRIRSLFTANESNIQAKVDTIKTWRTAWNTEKYRRKQEAEKKAQEELAKKSAASDYQVAVANAINAYYMTELKNNMFKLNQAYNNVSVEGFVDYKHRLRGYNPQLVPFEYNSAPSPYLSAEEMSELKNKVQNELYPILNGDFAEKMGAERDRLIELIPSRIEELKRAAVDPEAAKAAQERINASYHETAMELDQQHKNMQEAAAATADAEKLSNMFEATAVQPAAQLSKGTSVKQKYVASSHKAIIAIITWWVQNCMKDMTVEDLLKKFSFMFTAANKALNKGTKIEAEGLTHVDDITVRGAR